MKVRANNPIIASMLIGVFAASISWPAAAHEFTVAIVGDGSVADTEAQVAEVVRGFIVAADERDGHVNETSDGHLGGLDVQIRVLPSGAAAAVEELVGVPKDPADITFLLDPMTLAMSSGEPALRLNTVIFRPGALPPRNKREASSFDVRFWALYGRVPTEAAEQGYNAARRIDSAIRPLGGLEPRTAIEAALAGTVEGIDW
jgi:hypothetical protein